LHILISPVSIADEVHVRSWEFTIELNRGRNAPLSQQIARAISEDIQRGRLRPGDRLPGSRTLASTLQVHRQTVVTAIDELVAEEWLVSRKTAGIFVADGVPDPSLSRFRRTLRSSAAVAPRRFALDLSPAPEPEFPADVDSRTLLMSGSRPDVRLSAVRQHRSLVSSCRQRVRTSVVVLQPPGRLTTFAAGAGKDAVVDARRGRRT
jgi:DNA-binding transcriptional regulator YhcF (GntR family)